MFHVEQHAAHRRMQCSRAGTKAMFHVEQHATHRHKQSSRAGTKDMFHVEQHAANRHKQISRAGTTAPLRRQRIAWKSAQIQKSPYLRRVQHVACAASDCQTIKKSLLWQYFKTCGFAEQRRSSEARCCTPREAEPCRGSWLLR